MTTELTKTGECRFVDEHGNLILSESWLNAATGEVSTTEKIEQAAEEQPNE